MKIIYGVFILLFLSHISCTDNGSEELAEIQAYLANAGFSSIDTAGVFVVVESAGSIERPTNLSTIEMSYTARYLDDTVFDQSPQDQTIRLKLSSAINGLKYGLGKFGKQGKGIIIIPSALGYGGNPPFGVRKNAVLVYDVKVINF